MGNELQYFVVYKPFGMISQFSESGDKPTLASLYDFEKDIYPVGRLDTDSEGMLILTNDSSLNQKLLNPSNKQSKTYWVQVEGEPTQEAIAALNKGVEISIKGKKHHTAPAKAEIINPENLPERNPPIRFRKNVPTTWISLTITEGKNRQVRRMTAKVGYPTLRLIRVNIGTLKFDKLEPNAVRSYSKKEFYQILNI